MELLGLPIYIVAHKTEVKREVCVVVIQKLYYIVFLEVLDEIDLILKKKLISKPISLW